MAPRRRQRPLWPLFHWHVRGPVRVARGSSCDWHSVLTSESDRPLTMARHRDRRGPSDSESYWLTLVLLPGRTGPSMQPRARSPRHAELQQRLSPGLPGLESMHAQRIMRSLSCRPHRCSTCGCIPTAHPSESASVLTPHGLCY